MKNSHKKTNNKRRKNLSQTIAILFSYPVISINELSTHLEVAYNTVKQITADLVDLDILTKNTEQKLSPNSIYPCAAAAASPPSSPEISPPCCLNTCCQVPIPPCFWQNCKNRLLLRSSGDSQ